MYVFKGSHMKNSRTY